GIYLLENMKQLLWVQKQLSNNSLVIHYKTIRKECDFMYSDEQRIEHIRGLQQDLRVIHAKNDESLPKISGVYDVLTEDAVKRFQRRFGLPVTGKTDLTTWDKIVHESNLIRSKNSIPLAVRVFPNAMYVVSLGDT